MDDARKPGLTAFMAARLDEDEALAKRGEEVFAIGWPDYQTYDSPELDDANKYLGRFGPARALREVAAVRAILGRHSPFDPGDGRTVSCAWCGDDTHAGARWLEPWPCPDVRGLAAIWSGHPDYRAEWKPQAAAGLAFLDPGQLGLDGFQVVLEPLAALLQGGDLRADGGDLRVGGGHLEAGQRRGEVGAAVEESGGLGVRAVGDQFDVIGRVQERADQRGADRGVVDARRAGHVGRPAGPE